MKLTRTSITRAFAIAYLLIFITLGLYNPPLEPEVAEFLKLPTNSVPDAENGFFAMFGFAAPADQKMHPYGLARYKATIEASKNISLELTAEKNQLTFKGKELPKDNLYRFVAESKPLLDQLAMDNAVLLARYRELRRFRVFSEPVTQESLQEPPIPSFSPIRNTQSVYLLQILRQAHEGQNDQALSGLETDLTFWRTALKDARSLIAKLIAIASIQKDYQAAAELIRHARLSQQQLQRLTTMLPPWTPEMIGMDQAFRFEAMFLSASLEKTTGRARWLERLVFKKNATRNKMTRTFMAISKISQFPPDQLYKLRQGNSHLSAEQMRIGVEFLYNSVGAVLNSIAVPQVSGYLYKATSLEVKRRMVLILLKAKAMQIPVSTMAGFIQKLGPEYTNPYTKEPMQWDAKKNVLYIDSPETGRNDANRIELPF